MRRSLFTSLLASLLTSCPILAVADAGASILATTVKAGMNRIYCLMPEMMPMKRLLLAIIFSLCSGMANADWRLIEGTDERDVYVDLSTVKKMGDVVGMVSLHNYKIMKLESGKPYQSFKRNMEYDCRAARFRLVKGILYSANMGRGSIVKNIGTEGWQSSETTEPFLWNIVCVK